MPNTSLVKDIGDAQIIRSRSASPQRPKVYKCLEQGCGKSYSRPSLLEQHMRSHTDNRPFVCAEPNCATSFTRKDHLERHMLKHTEEKDKPFHCSICDKGVNTKQHLKRHEKTHFKSFVCPHDGCDEAFHKHQSLKSHISQKHEDGEDRLTCKTCDKKFSRPNRLKDHMDKHHNTELKLMCDYPDCYQSFRVWSALQLHIKNDHPRLQCEICGKKVIGPKGLTNHFKIHDETTVIKLWKCSEDQCESKFHKKEDIVKHYARDHPHVSLPNELLYGFQQNQILDNGQLVTTESYTDNDNFIEKYDFLVSSPTSKTDQYSKLIIDAQRSKRVRESETWKRAPDPLDLLTNNVDTRTTCPYVACKKKFQSQSSLDKHLKTVHNEEQPEKRIKVD